MTKKIMIATFLVIGALTAVTGLGYATGMLQTVYAQSAQQATTIANRNEVNVSVDGKAVKIVAYNISGYNYLRIADICKALGMKVFYYPTDLGNGVKIISNEEFDGIVEEAPTEKSLTVTIKDINVFYDGGYIKAKCFNVGGHNYIKLADIVAAANNNYEIKLESVQKHSKNGTGQAVTTRPTTIDLKTSFDGSTNTITIVKTKTDFQKLYEELYLKEQGKAPIEAEKVDVPQNNAAQPELTEAPKVGTILAKILIDESKPAYIDGDKSKGVGIANITPTYAASSVYFGQCTWYAEGRFEEVTGVNLPNSLNMYNLADVEKYDNLKAIIDANDITSRSIAVFGDVHVVFVEYVERDVQGNPTYIYSTEGNTGRNGTYRPDYDGKVQKLDFKAFINRQSTYKGCITIK